jgi:hypothetical protein
MDKAFNSFKPRTAFDLIKVEDIPQRLIKHKLTDI